MTQMRQVDGEFEEEPVTVTKTIPRRVENITIRDTQTSNTVTLNVMRPPGNRSTSTQYIQAFGPRSDGPRSDGQTASYWNNLLNQGQVYVGVDNEPRIYSDFSRDPGSGSIALIDSLSNDDPIPSEYSMLSEYLLIKVEPGTNIPIDGDTTTTGTQISRVFTLTNIVNASGDVLLSVDAHGLGQNEEAKLIKRPERQNKVAVYHAGGDVTTPQLLVGDQDINTDLTAQERDTIEMITILKTDDEISAEITMNMSLMDDNDPATNPIPIDQLLMYQQVPDETEMLTVEVPIIQVDGQTVSVVIEDGTRTEEVVTIRRVPKQVEEEVERHTPLTNDNSGIAMSSSAEIAFETSFTGSDKLTFKLKGDVISKDKNHYLALGNFYDVADSGSTDVEFSGFAYETSFDMSGLMGNLVFGTDVNEFDPIKGMDVYYDNRYDGYGPSDFGNAGIGANMELISGSAGTMTASAAYAVDADDASNQSGEHGVFGEETDRSGVLALNWSGALLGGNEAMLTVAYHDVKQMMNSMEMSKNYWHFVAGTYITDTISFSGSYSLGEHDTKDDGMDEMDSAQWMFGVQFDDLIIPGNSAGIAYGTPEYMKDPRSRMVLDDKGGYKEVKGSDQDPITVLELYYNFAVNDNFEVPIYMNFISNAGYPMGGNGTEANALSVGIHPTLSF